MQIAWYIPAIGAALVWGLHYPIVDFALKRLSIFGVLLLSVIPVFLLTPLFLRELAGDFEAFKALPAAEKYFILVVPLTSTIGAVLLYMSINGKNATLASLIEITYPVFVVIFAYVLFRQVHFNPGTLSGGLLIMLGAGLVIYNNQ